MDPKELTDLFVYLTSDKNLSMRIYYNNFIKPVVKKYIKPTDNMIDLGCAAGLLLQLLARDGYTNLYGMEQKKILLDQIKDNRIKTICDSYLDLNRHFSENTFDAITIFNTIHHLDGIEEYKNVFENIWRVTKDGGIVVVKEPYKSIGYSIYNFLIFTLVPVFSKTFTPRRTVVIMEKTMHERFFSQFYPNIHEILFSEGKFELVRQLPLFHEKMLILKIKKRTHG